MKSEEIIEQLKLIMAWDQLLDAISKSDIKPSDETHRKMISEGVKAERKLIDIGFFDEYGEEKTNSEWEAENHPLRDEFIKANKWWSDTLRDLRRK